MTATQDTEDAAPAQTRIVLIRHGESVGNATQTITWANLCGGLSDAGREQCERLAKRLDRTGELAGAVLYASHVRRAMETAEHIAPVLGGPEVAIDERFAEINPGPDCEGITYTELLERFNPDRNGDDPDIAFFPGGETMTDFVARITEGLVELADRHAGQLVAICSHGGVVDAAMRMALRLPPRGWFDLMTVNTSLTAITDTGWARWRIERYNDAAHLLDGFVG